VLPTTGFIESITEAEKTLKTIEDVFGHAWVITNNVILLKIWVYLAMTRKYSYLQHCVVL
jgi:hypothetical protein